MTRLLLWLKSTLLLKNKWDCTAIYMKTQCLQTNKTQHCLGKENAFGAGGRVERVALIKSLISARKKKTCLGRRVAKFSWKVSADMSKNNFKIDFKRQGMWPPTNVLREIGWTLQKIEQIFHRSLQVLAPFDDIIK